VDDVPIVAITFSPAAGSRYDDAQLRLVADHVLDELRKVPGVGNTTVIGGRSRQVRVTLDPMRIAGYGLSPLQIAGPSPSRTPIFLQANLSGATRSSPSRPAASSPVQATYGTPWSEWRTTSPYIWAILPK
jgi:hypothetical protein